MLPRLPSYAVGKKRDRDEYLASSSDAPLFSSDDLPSSSSENYLQHRNKLQHRRRWYEAEDNGNVVTKRSPVRIPRPRGPFKRTADSAVWLGSDDSSDNEDVDWDKAKHNRLNVMEKSESTDWDDDGLDIGDENFELENTHIPEDDKRLKLMEKALQTIEDPGDSEGPVFPYFQKQPDHLQGFHFFQEQAREIVTSCIDLGGECVDLS